MTLQLKHDERLTMTVMELKEVLGIGTSKAYEIIHAQGFPVITVGRKKLIIKSKLNDWLENNAGKIL